ncbi:MAG TPA: TrkH family potassium uptake protein [Candidatus Bathyarchaeia archaeon]|nr:TrkH family potassium uptake protein [Candidatus Bathyarchaeia archaeon]
MRRNPHLLTRYKAILAATGGVLVLGGIGMLTPLLALLGWPGEYVYAPQFIVPAFLEIVLGAVIWRLFRTRTQVALTLQEGAIIVFLSWVVIAAFSAVPYVDVCGYSITNALFESVSGWSGTGLTVTDVLAVPHVILLWRSITQYIGGAGLALIMLATIAGPLGQNLSVAEGRTDQLAPHVRDSAKIVLVLYTGYAILGILALWAAGMTFFEAVNHAFTGLGTGGFSTRPESIAYFDSPRIEAVVIVLMLLGGTNFLTAYLLLQGKLGLVWRNAEIRLSFVAIVLSLFILAATLFYGRVFPQFAKTLRVACFEPISALTGTGFQTTVYRQWSGLPLLLLITLMVIGGGAGSTSGALKQIRVYIVFRSILWEFRRSMLPKSIVEENYIWYGPGKLYVDDRRIRMAQNYIAVYLIGLIIGTAVVAAHGYPVGDALFEYASAQGTVGLSLGITNATTPPLILWTMMAGMFLGRLEFYVIFVSIVKIINDARHMSFR